MKLKHFLSRNVLTGLSPAKDPTGSASTSGPPSAVGSSILAPGPSTQGSAPPEQLLAALSYEARTALTNIVGSADIISQHREDMPSDIRDAAGTILQSSRLLLRAVDAVFLLTSLQQSNVDMYMEAVDMNAVMTRSCEHPAQLIAERKINLQVDSNLSHKWYTTDARGLGMVLDHILELIVRQTDTSSTVRIGVSAYVSQVEVGKAGLKFRLTHEGKPLSPHIEYTLASFNNTQAPMARPGVSAGSPYDYLLLAVANRVARLLGGSIQPIAGTSGSGLALDLPCVSPADPVLVVKQESPSSSPTSMKNSPPMPKFLGVGGAAAVLMGQVDEEDDASGRAPVLRRSSQPHSTRKRPSVSSAAAAQPVVRLSPASSQMATADAQDAGALARGEGKPSEGMVQAPATALIGTSFMEAVMSVEPMSAQKKAASADISAEKQGQRAPVDAAAASRTGKEPPLVQSQPAPTSTSTGPDSTAAAPALSAAATDTVLDANGSPQQLWMCPPDDVLVPPKKKHERQVLVVEDDTINQRIIRAMLTKLGYKQITFAADGADALFHYNSMKEEGKYFDIILLDQSLPSLSGDDTCARIRRNDRTQVIISCSANAQLTNDPELCRALGYDEAINKPIYLDLLAEVLNRWTIAGDARRLRHTKRKLKHEAIAAGLAVTTASFAASVAPASPQLPEGAAPSAGNDGPTQ